MPWDHYIVTAPYVVAMARVTSCGKCFDVAMRPYDMGSTEMGMVSRESYSGEKIY